MDADTFYRKMHSSMSQTCLDVACDYLDGGYTDEAIALLAGVPAYTDDIAPTLAYMIGRPELASAAHRTFPHRPEETAVLEANAEQPMARYLLGCAYYARRHYDRAGELWSSCEGYEAERALAAAGGRCKTAIAMLLLGCDAEEADACLQKADGHLRQAVEKAV
jgi:hypothetical protein